MSAIDIINLDSTQSTIATKPKIPYFGTLPGLSPGSMITVYGRVPRGAKRFSFNIMVGSVITEQLKKKGDVGLHFNVRFDEELVARNHLKNGKWGPEERESHDFPFNAGQDFKVMILCEDSGYKIAVNGNHFIDFVHRIPLSCCRVFSIDGTVDVHRIDIKGEIGFLPIPYEMAAINPSEPLNLQSIFSPPLPIKQKFTEGLKSGFMIYISGRLIKSPEEFTIDLLSKTKSNKDIALHFNARVKEATVVRNSYINKKWGKEEREIPSFPFFAGVNFDLIIGIDFDRCMLAVNGQHFIEYKHRIPPIDVNGMKITGDIVIDSIRFSQS